MLENSFLLNNAPNKLNIIVPIIPLIGSIKITFSSFIIQGGKNKEDNLGYYLPLPFKKERKEKELHRTLIYW